MQSRKFIWVILIGAVVIAAGWIVFAILYARGSGWNYASISPNAEYWGQVLSGAFGLLGNAILLIALFLQWQELSAQRDDTAKAQRIAARQAEQIERQAQLAEKQAIIAQMLEIGKIKVELERKGEAELGALPGSGEASEMQKVREKRIRLRREWEARVDPLVDLLRELAKRDLLSREEARSLLMAAGVFDSSAASD